MTVGYDIIGDVHGHATRLQKLLKKLGYSKSADTFAHPQRQAVFVGDIVDRGPEIRESLSIVKSMVTAGTALTVLGNHEFNALTYDTYVEGKGWLREHNEEHKRQSAETLAQVANPYPIEWTMWLDWFATLPLSLQLNGIRVVHAAWDDKATAFFNSKPRITRELLIEMADSQHPAGVARERLLSGVKIALPSGYWFIGKSGQKRTSIRVKWWIGLARKTYQSIAFPPSSGIPGIRIPNEAKPKHVRPYRVSEPPVFIGHYWLPPEHRPQPVAPNIACLDYSVVAGGPLVAYSWNGESKLREENFVLA